LLTSLLDRSSVPSLGWVAALRDAVVQDPTSAAAGLSNRSAHELLARGLSELLAGEVSSAALALQRARDRADASPTVSLAAGLGLLVASYLAGVVDPVAADDLERAATALDIPFLVRLCRAAGGMVTGALDLVDAVVDDSDRTGDEIGAALAALCAAIARAWGPAAPTPVTSDALDRCGSLGLRTLEVWANVAMALGSVGQPNGPALAAAADSAARRRGLWALQELAGLGVLAATPGSDVLARAANALTSTYGIAVPARFTHGDDPTATPDSPADATAKLRVECLGRFAVTRGDDVIALDGLRPRARAVLRMLAVHLGTGVHRQALCDELWPDDDETGASRKLQVAISSIRRVLETNGSGEVVGRRGDVYLLDVDRGVACDVHEFSTAVGDARSLVGRGATADAEPILRRAIELYAGDLLPDDGAADWVVTLRHQLQASATDAAHSLGALLLHEGRPAEAVGVCRWGLATDRYSDPLWRLLLDSLQADGDLAGRALAMARYDELLAELGVRRPDRHITG
jgi:DNA-binding SARP family transcriptional activator